LSGLISSSGFVFYSSPGFTSSFGPFCGPRFFGDPGLTSSFGSTSSFRLTSNLARGVCHVRPHSCTGRAQQGGFSTTHPQSGSCKNSLRANQQIIGNENRARHPRRLYVSAIAE
jgi:hypothetical protein